MMNIYTREMDNAYLLNIAATTAKTFAGVIATLMPGLVLVAVTAFTTDYIAWSVMATLPIFLGIAVFREWRVSRSALWSCSWQRLQELESRSRDLKIWVFPGAFAILANGAYLTTVHWETVLSAGYATHSAVWSTITALVALF